MSSGNFRKVEELYHAALARGRDERDLFLKESCGDDETLYREVTSLLGYEQKAKDLLEEPVMEATTKRVAVVQGTRLGPYEVGDLIGAGGMGEVYRARDTRLGREVAVKVLPERVAKDAEALARFKREARTLAGLNHSRICALHDVGQEGDVHYLVMEFVDGETLAQRLRRGTLPIDQVLLHAIDVAEALGAAHMHGIIHRDLKPGNIMLTRGGAKLLDFGLAKLRPADGMDVASGERSLSRDNVVAGTPPYMAPEQLESGRADARTDVFALGAVIYEMATGEPAFAGDSPASVIASVVKGEVPSLVARRPTTPAALDRLAMQCLRKDADERWQSAQDVALRLREIAETRLQAPGRRQVAKALRWALPAVSVATVTMLVADVFVGHRWRLNSDARIVSSSIELTDQTALGCAFGRTALALSPDGTQLVWSTSGNGAMGNGSAPYALYLRRLDSDEVKRIGGTEGAEEPFFSPDGRWIGFFTRHCTRLRKIPAQGGLAVDLADITPSGALDASWVAAMGASWAPDGRIFIGMQRRGLQWVPAEGGPVRELTTVDRSREVGHRLPAVLPGGRTLLFTTMPHVDGLMARVEAFSLASGERKVVVEDGADARYLPSGHLLFVRRGVLMAAPFDLKRVELAAPPVPVVDGVLQMLDLGDANNSGAAQFAVSDTGLLVYASGGVAGSPAIAMVLLDEVGRPTPLPGFNKDTVAPHGRFSPDGRQYAFVEQARSGLLWIFDVQRQTFRALSDSGMAGPPVWSPDGTRLAVSWSKAGPFHLWVLPAQGGGEWERLTEGELYEYPCSWSPDGRFLAFIRESGPPSRNDIFLYRFEGRQVIPFLTTKADEWFPEFSPDGQWLAYVSNESGMNEVYVTSFPDRKRTLTVSRQGGIAPVWSRDGTKLYYHSPDGERMMVVAVRRDTSLSLGQAKTLFRLPEGFADEAPMRGVELHPDGRRFLVGRFVGKDVPPPTRLHLVENWFTELERLSPTRR